MSMEIEREEVCRMAEDGAQLVEVLPTKGSGQIRVHPEHGMNTIIPSTGSSQVLTSEAFVI
jgi:hypothetical protein